jgi:FkbM family methyltransferase
MLKAAAKSLAVGLNRFLVRKPIAVPTPQGFRFTLLPDDPKSLKMASGFYEREDVALYRKLRFQPGVVVDVGANVGFFTLLFAKLFSQCDVHAIEPNPYSVERLRQNLAVNPRLRRRVTVHACAAGAEDSSVKLTAYPGAKGHAWVRIGIEAEPGMFDYQVPQKRLDDLFPDGKNPVRLMKIDVEGYELEVLKGATTLVERDKPIVVFEVSLSFLIEKPGVYQQELEFA